MIGQKDKIAIVILNYKTAEDTIALVKNIEKQTWSERIKIYIVDNGSSDDSVKKLDSLKCCIDVELIESKINLGFAKGNNIGIKKALTDRFKFVIASNSDILIKKQSDFLEKIDEIYSKDQNIAVIAPSIKNLDGICQNPFRKERFSDKEIVKMKYFYLSGMYRLYYFFRVYILFGLITYIVQKKRHKRITNYVNKVLSNGYIYAPHGSFLIFTPTFFKYFDGFDDNTFLYCEEFILAENLRQQGLRCWYENSLKILHKECQSREKITNSYKEKVKFTLKHTFESCRYFAKIIKIR